MFRACLRKNIDAEIITRVLCVWGRKEVELGISLIVLRIKNESIYSHKFVLFLRVTAAWLKSNSIANKSIFSNLLILRWSLSTTWSCHVTRLTCPTMTFFNLYILFCVNTCFRIVLLLVIGMSGLTVDPPKPSQPIQNLSIKASIETDLNSELFWGGYINILGIFIC